MLDLGIFPNLDVNMPKVTLEQWRMLKAVVDAGGFAKAAELVHKSPSSINHAVQKLQVQLGVPLLEVQGRRAVLTPAGEAILRRAGHLLDEAQDMEKLAGYLAQGVHPELHVAIDQIIPQPLVIDALQAFAGEFPQMRVQLHECILAGGSELLLCGAVDLLVGPSVPSTHLGEHLGEIHLLCVAHPEHALAKAKTPRTLRDLRSHRQVVVRATGKEQEADDSWLDAEYRWTVGHVHTALQMVLSGLAFGWLPECLVREPLKKGQLVELDLDSGSRQVIPVSLVVGDSDRAGKSAQSLAQVLKQTFQHKSMQQHGSPDWWISARCESRAEG